MLHFQRPLYLTCNVNIIAPPLRHQRNVVLCGEISIAFGGFDSDSNLPAPPVPVFGIVPHSNPKYCSRGANRNLPSLDDPHFLVEPLLKRLKLHQCAGVILLVADTLVLRTVFHISELFCGHLLHPLYSSYQTLYLPA